MGILKNVCARFCSPFRKADDEKGQTAIEYILVIALVVVALILAMNVTGLNTVISNAITYITNQIP